jgi:hypothetical protein
MAIFTKTILCLHIVYCLSPIEKYFTQMEFNIENHILGLFGSFSLVFWIVLDFIKITLKENKKYKLTEYFNFARLVLFVLIVVMGQIFIVVQEYFYGLYVWQKDNQELWNFYIDNEELISFVVGMSSTFIVGFIVTAIKSKLRKLGS